jgi:DNA-directed RNA polymerase subunit M/transcription elongation factor TFIIS
MECKKHRDITYRKVKMKFCVKCDNMYYISIDNANDDQLIYYCRYCGHKDEHLTEEGVVVLKTQYKKNEQKFNHMVNQYTKLDPTLPRIYNMKCPSAECPTNKESASATAGPCEIIYLRYDDDNMKYLYICTTCDTSWKTDDNK